VALFFESVSDSRGDVRDDGPAGRRQEGPGECLVDFVGRFENLQRDFATVATRLGLPSAELPHAMKSPRRPPLARYYNSRTRDLIANIFARDIELFGYEFAEGVSARF
jgi:hypothetical protein